MWVQRLCYLCVGGFALFGTAESALNAVGQGQSMVVGPPVETTADVLEAVARAAGMGSLSNGAGPGLEEYALARQRMLDAEEIAIRRIVRKSLASTLAKSVDES